MLSTGKSGEYETVRQMKTGKKPKLQHGNLKMPFFLKGGLIRSVVGF